MLKSATGAIDIRGPGPGTRDPGFTLVEILVVLTILAVLTGVVVLRTGTGGPDDARMVLERLAALSRASCDQAVFQGAPRGIRLTTRGYDFWQSGPDGWLPVGQATFRPRAWTDDFSIAVTLDEQSLRLTADPRQPQLVCTALGELTPFTLELRGNGAPIRLAGSPDGQFQID